MLNGVGIDRELFRYVMKEFQLRKVRVARFSFIMVSKDQSAAPQITKFSKIRPPCNHDSTQLYKTLLC